MNATEQAVRNFNRYQVGDSSGVVSEIVSDGVPMSYTVMPSSAIFTADEMPEIKFSPELIQLKPCEPPKHRFDTRDGKIVGERCRCGEMPIKKMT